MRFAHLTQSYTLPALLFLKFVKRAHKKCFYYNLHVFDACVVCLYFLRRQLSFAYAVCDKSGSFIFLFDRAILNILYMATFFSIKSRSRRELWIAKIKIDLWVQLQAMVTSLIQRLTVESETAANTRSLLHLYSFYNLKFMTDTHLPQQILQELELFTESLKLLPLWHL